MSGSGRVLARQTTMNEMRYFHARLQRGAQTLAYLAALSGLLMLSGWLMLGGLGVAMMLALTAVALLASSQLPVAMVMRLRGARPLEWGEGQSLERLVQRLAGLAGLEQRPAIYVLPSAELQAFAVSSGGQAAIGVTPSLVRSLRPEELEGVLAHEISHLTAGDLRVMGAATAMRSLTRSLASVAWVLLALSLLTLGAIQVSLSATLVLGITPLLSYLAELGLSRTREFSADLAAARLTGRPGALASALVKLERQQAGLIRRLLGARPLLQLPEALRTHPPTKERVQRLLELQGLDSPSRGSAMAIQTPSPSYPVRSHHPSDGRRTRLSVMMV